jgi:hypothetical protein
MVAMADRFGAEDVRRKRAEVSWVFSNKHKLPNKRMQLTVWPVTTLASGAGVLAAPWPLGQGRASPARS